MMAVFSVWDDFFHSRVGYKACRLAGWVRVGFAVLFLADRFLLSMDFAWFFGSSSNSPLFPLHSQMAPANCYSIFQLAPKSSNLLWFMHFLGLFHGFLLLLGVAPRLQLFGIFVNLVSFQNYTTFIWEGEDNAFRIWCFFLMFMPLHRVTICDYWRTNSSESQRREDTWPIWPFRLFQLELCIAYIGAGLGKLPGKQWKDGTALYHLSYMSDFWGGPFTPDILYNRLGPLKILCWVSLVVECTCWIVVWFKPLRVPTVIVMVLFHVGIDFAMNMHCFEWLFILAWLMFLVEPVTKNEHKKSSWPRRLLTNVFLLTIFVMFTFDTLPMQQIHKLAPKRLKRYTDRVWLYVDTTMNGPLGSVLNAVGLQQEPWILYDGNHPDNGNHYFQARLEYENGTLFEWHGPDWSVMPWHVKKRHQRSMTFYEACEDDAEAQLLLMQSLVREHGPHVVSVNLSMTSELSPRPPPDLHLWLEPARQPMVRDTKPLNSWNVEHNEL